MFIKYVLHRPPRRLCKFKISKRKQVCKMRHLCFIKERFGGSRSHTNSESELEAAKTTTPQCPNVGKSSILRTKRFGETRQHCDIINYRRDGPKQNKLTKRKTSNKAKR
eukprot:Pompholyxophrys_punicea_v1_NODE_389_length_2073_cov_14.173439.p3 type:complete len:109 gc:universal NODE_389_length_2073_cov_14.173439:700-1026(+)